MDHSLKDGTRVLVRPIKPSDKDRLRVALGRLSQEAIRRRFLAAKPRFSSAELSYLTEVDGHNHLALVAVLADDPESIVAVARCVRLPLPRPEASSPLRSAPETAEFAIVVGDPFQRRGLGTLMARALADAAQAVGIRRFAATMLSDNVAVRRLMDKFAEGLDQERVDHGVRELVVDLAA